MPDISDPTPPYRDSELADTDQTRDRIRHRWKSIVLCIIISMAIAISATYLRAPEFAARTSVFFPSRSSILGGSSIIDSVGPSSAGLGVGPSPIRVFQAFLESETAVNDIAKTFGITKQKLADNREIDSDPRTNILTITFVAPDPSRAKSVLDSHIAELKKINSKVSFDTLQDDLKVLEDRLKEAKERMHDAETELVAYEKSSISAPTIAPGGGGIAATPGAWAQNLIQLQLEQEKIDTTLFASRARVEALSKLGNDIPSELPPIKRLRPKLLDLEYDLAVRRRTLGPDAPEITILNAKISVLREALSKELMQYFQGVKTDIIDPTVREGELPAMLTSRTVIEAQIAVLRRLAAAAPAESMTMTRLYAQVNLQAGIVQQLTNQSLNASLQSQRDPNRWVVLDEPWVNDKPVNKSFGRAALLGSFLGLLVGVSVALLRRL